jgi:hypothetical protein
VPAALPVLQGVADVRELGAGLAAEGGEGDDADHSDEGEEQGVLHEGGATLGVAEAIVTYLRARSVLPKRACR